MTISAFLLIVAILLFLIASLLAFGVISGGASVIGLVALASGFFAAAHF